MNFCSRVVSPKSINDLPKGIEVSPNCLKMLLKYCGNLIFGRFMVNGR